MNASSPLVTLRTAPRETTASQTSLAAIRAIHDQPLLDLLLQAQQVHRQHHTPNEVELASLLSIKTGACPEDCAYCPQSGRYQTHVEPERLLEVQSVVDSARLAKAAGATRFCMGAAWREARRGPAFEQVLQMIREVKALGLETCVTLGMVSADQAAQLKAAGLDTYNHNVDTSPEFYSSIITTRTFQDRLTSIRHVQAHGINVCCGGIIGMGESIDDRCRMLQELAELSPHPTSVPINALVPVAGTPLADRPPVEPIEIIRMVGTARILMPKARVRLSAGRTELSWEAQWLCFMAGANSLFVGGQLLTTPNPEMDGDLQMLRRAGIQPRMVQE